MPLADERQTARQLSPNRSHRSAERSQGNRHEYESTREPVLLLSTVCSIRDRKR